MVNCLQVSPSNSSPQRQQRQQFRHAFASLTSDSLDSWDFDDHHQGECSMYALAVNADSTFQPRSLVGLGTP
eukprot:scaffold55989_cov26-Tisochrysis_lutea.AAC.1